MLGGFVGSTVGSYVPVLWGDSGLSVAALFTGFVGAILGIWGGYRLGESFGE